MKITVSPKMALAMRPKKVKEFKGKKPVQWAQVKENGYFVSIMVDRRKKRWAIGKKEDYWPELSENPTIGPLFRSVPPNTVIDGELFLPGGRATQVITAIKKRDPALTFKAFAVPVLRAVDYRTMYFDEAMGLLEANGFKVPEWEEISLWEDDLIDFYLERAVEQEIEGFVLKNAHYSEWYKVKPDKTVDLVITGVKWSDSTNWMGYVGAILCSAYDKDGELVEVCSTSGMTMDVREDITDMEEAGELVGKVVEVKYQEVESHGRLQFPRFQRFRDDKPAEDCKLEQLR